MKKSTIFSLLAVLGMAATAQAQTLMAPGTLDYPAGLYASFPPSSVSVTYDNQPIELVNPHLNDWDEEVVTAYVKLGEGEELPVSAAIISSFGNPEDPEDTDIWNLDIALYEIDDLWSFDGNSLTVIIPEGVVMNADGDINPAQDFEFHILPTYTDYSVTPDTGATLVGDATVSVGFGGNPLEYLQSSVSARTYDPVYMDIQLEYGKEVTISDDNEIVIDLSGLAPGEYEVVVPEGFVFVTVDGEKWLSPDIWLEYTIEIADSGVSSVETAEEGSAVYTLKGVKVNGQPSKGIYIVNGRKVVVK